MAGEHVAPSSDGTVSALRRSMELGIIAALVIAAGYIGTTATIPNIPTWYAGINKPSFNPPNWVFGPVWTSLYLLMIWSCWRVLGVARHTPLLKPALGFFAVQLVLNALWSVVFFGLQSPGWALLVIVALELTLMAMILVFAQIDEWAAASQMPYVFWVAFATILNLSVYLLNLPDAPLS